MIVTLQHLRTVPTWTTRQGYCANKGRAFFKMYGLDWSKFVNEGIDSEILLATGNALAIHLVEFAKQQTATQSNKKLVQALEEFE